MPYHRKDVISPFYRALPSFARPASSSLHSAPHASNDSNETLNKLRAVQLATLFALAAIVGGRAALADAPNILCIMSDDHAAHAIGAYGGRLAALNPTPNLDRLAAKGCGSTTSSA